MRRVWALTVVLVLAGCSQQQVRSAARADVAPSASGQPTPTASVGTSSTSVAPPPSSPANQPRSGKPTAVNTGVLPGTNLTIVNGDKTFSAAGQIVVGMDFRGFVHVTAANVTFKNCIFRGRATSNNASLLDTTKGSNTTVQDSEFVAANPSAGIDGIWASKTTIVRANIHGAVDGIKANSDVLIQDSYIHDMTWFASDPNQNGGPTHNDGVQSFDGDVNVVLRHNNIDMSSTKSGNATWQSSAANSRVEGNWLDGGNCTLNFAHEGNTPLTGIHVVNNRFGRHSFFDCPILISTKTTLAENVGNVWDDTGKPIPPPEQHD